MEGTLTARAPLEVEVLTTEDAVRQVRPEWDRLYEQHEPRNPFLSPGWSEACWSRVRPRASLFVVAARQEGRLVALAPLRLERQLGFRVLRFLGDGRSDYLGSLRLPGYEVAETWLLVALLHLRGAWDVALLRQLSPPHSCLHLAPLPAGLRGQVGGDGAAAFVACPGDWEALREAGPGWVRRMPKQVRKWNRAGGSAQRFVGEAAVAQVPEVGAIEARSWKGRAGTGRFQPGSGQVFLRTALEGLGAREEMELWLAYVHGTPVAFEINLLTPDRLWLYQGAYDEAYRNVSAGSVLEFLSIERAWQNGVREYDYLGGDEAYKAERTNASRPVRHLAVCPDTWRGRLAMALLVTPSWRLQARRAKQGHAPRAHPSQDAAVPDDGNSPSSVSRIAT
jgi:CelD/BcsL family acetyltransferase involved in cellulose biosynthesis